ncbi:MAG: PhzF family phenazine biosynthesis protein [Leptolyngbyaceae cyanobacterium CSU_1_3]|nr:PhzF family phenazine biosynthesis protein [Leptolyngbyaceae cyanobacterium CSU_1_3]
MENLPFYIVDVFAEEKYAGNQLAVFRNAAHLSTQQMQRIAKEINFSETTFILSEVPRDGGYEVRIFTPKQELPFAGHPTLGTAFVLQQEVIQQPVETVRLNLQVGQISVTVGYRDGAIDLLWMRQNPPVFGQKFAPETIAPILNLDPSDLDDRYPIQAVSTGLPFIIVPLKDRRSLQQAKTNQARLFDLIATTEAQATLLFCPVEHPDYQLSVRVFVDAMGIPEDPATGSANGCLAGYLVEYGYFEGDRPVDIRVEQGSEIGRPSLLFLRAQKKPAQTLGETIEVSVGGHVVAVARGEFL